MEEKPNACRVLLSSAREPNKLPPDSSLSYFFSITITQPKIRVRIPKLLAKTVQKRRGSQNEFRGNGTSSSANGFRDKEKEKNQQKWGKPARNIGDLVPKKVGSIFCSVFSNKKSSHSTTCDCSGSSNKFRTSDVPVLPMSLNSFKRLLEIEEDNEEERGETVKGGGNENNPPKRMPVSCFFNKSNGLNCKRGKMKKNDPRENGVRGSGCCYDCVTCGGMDNSNRGEGSAAGRHEESRSSSSGSSKFTRIPSRILTTRKSLKMARSLRKMSSERQNGGVPALEDEERGGDSGKELCKKKIMLGEKCKPLNYSGILRYDEDGILLPEFDLPW